MYIKTIKVKIRYDHHTKCHQFSFYFTFYILLLQMLFSNNQHFIFLSSLLPGIILLYFYQYFCDDNSIDPYTLVGPYVYTCFYIYNSTCWSLPATCVSLL